jgi:hypothetical protein
LTNADFLAKPRLIKLFFTLAIRFAERRRWAAQEFCPATSRRQTDRKRRESKNVENFMASSAGVSAKMPRQWQEKVSPVMSNWQKGEMTRLMFSRTVEGQ